MIIAFLLITGVALLYLSVIKMDIGESYVLSAVTLILVVYAFGMWRQDLLLGKKVYVILATVGFLATAVRLILRKLPEGKRITIYILLLFAVLVCSRIMCYGDFVRHSDEFHMWALAPKYMLKYNRLPIYQNFLGGARENVGTCIFNYFCQPSTGFHEATLYVSNMFLSWIGLLLPLGNEKNQNWVKNITYVLIIYFSVTMMYMYGMPNAYVDVPTVSWMAGLAGWTIHREKGKRVRRVKNVMFIFAMIYVVHMFKSWAGLILAVFSLLFLFAGAVVSKPDVLNKRIKISRWITAGIVLASVLLFCFIWNVDLQKVFPESLLARFVPAGYSLLKVRQTMESMMLGICGKSLNSLARQMDISFLETVGIGIGIVFLHGIVNDCLNKAFVYCHYLIVCSIAYSWIVLAGYISSLSDLFSTSFWSGPRYLSIMSMYIVITTVALLLFDQGKTKKQWRYSEYIALGILLFFISGIRTGFLSNYTPIKKEASYRYIDIKKQGMEAEEIQKTVGTDKKVYFLNQKGAVTNDFGMKPALYFMDVQLSDYRQVPWRYNKAGGAINVSYFGAYDNTLEAFPRILGKGDYSYVWIYQTDKFLNKNLPRILKITGKDKKDQSAGREISIIDGQLYKVIYNDAKVAVELKLVNNLKPYDNRHWHNGY